MNEQELDKAIGNLSIATARVFREIGEAVTKFADAIIDVLTSPKLQEIFKAYFGLIDIGLLQACKAYPNKRIVHLALHGKNQRIRKKNKAKIMRYYSALD